MPQDEFRIEAAMAHLLRIGVIAAAVVVAAGALGTYALFPHHRQQRGARA